MARMFSYAMSHPYGVPRLVSRTKAWAKRPKTTGDPSMKRLIYALTLAALSASTALAQTATDKAPAKITVLYDYPLPNVRGKSIKGVLVEYGPGGSTPAH